MVGRLPFPFARPIFRGELLVLGSVFQYPYPYHHLVNLVYHHGILTYIWLIFYGKLVGKLPFPWMVWVSYGTFLTSKRHAREKPCNHFLRSPDVTLMRPKRGLWGLCLWDSPVVLPVSLAAWHVYPPKKTNMSSKRDYFNRKYIWTNHWFSGAMMLVLGRVEDVYTFQKTFLSGWFLVGNQEILGFQRYTLCRSRTFHWQAGVFF